MKKLFYLFASLGIVLVFCSILGRFIEARTVFGCVIHGGISASSVMIGANTLLLLAIIAHLLKKD